MTLPWSNFYHCIANTYGTWLPGDPRGFRTYKHHEHVAGDYQNPPPLGTHDKLFALSRRLMKRNPVYLDERQQRIILDVVVAAFKHYSLSLACAGIAATHLHILARFPHDRLTSTNKPIRDPARHFFGIARKRAARSLSDQGLAPQGGIWSKRCAVKPIRDREHFHNTYKYILAHEAHGAITWSNADLQLDP